MEFLKASILCVSFFHESLTGPASVCLLNLAACFSTLQTYVLVIHEHVPFLPKVLGTPCGE